MALLRAFASSRVGFALLCLLLAGIAVVLGWQMGQAVTQPIGTLVVPLVLIGFCVLLTLVRPLEGLLLTLILQPFVNQFYLNVDLGRGIPDLSLTRIVVAMDFVLVLAAAAADRNARPLLTAVEVCLILTALGLGLAALRSDAITSDLQMLFDMYLAPFMIYFIVRSLVRDRPALQRVLWAVVFIGTYCAVYGIYTQTTGQILFVPEGGLVGPVWYSRSLRIMRGLLDSPHVFGLVFSLAIPVAFYLLIKAGTTGRRVLYGLLLAVLLGALFVTYKRTAWIATLASFAVTSLFIPRVRRLILTLVVLAGAVALLGADTISESAIASERIGANAETLNGRLGLWDAALQEWYDEPLLGHGFGGFEANSGLQAVESNYLWVLVDGGLVAFVPFVAIFLALLWRSARLYRARAPGALVERELLATFWGCMVAYLVSLSTVVMNHQLPHAMFFLLAGALAGAGQPRNEGTPYEVT